MDSDMILGDEIDNSFKLDKEFENAQSISLIELIALLKHMESEWGGLNQENTPVFTQTRQYAERFNKYGFSETSGDTSTKAMNVRAVLGNSRVGFSEIERTHLLDLLPQKADEAFKLIPSLRRKLTEDAMQNYLEQLKNLASGINEI